MKRLLVLVLLALLVGLGVWYAVHQRSPKVSSTKITSLLPAETLALVHLPDFSRTRAQWHESDLYKLWREPAVQEFLEKPLGRAPQRVKAQEKFAQIDQLQMKDAFLAITAWEKNQLQMVGGFHFEGSAQDAEKVIGGWRARVHREAPEVKQEKVSYEGHEIEVLSRDAITIATVYDGQWFFAANGVEALKALLDRADGRGRGDAATLGAEENFKGAFRHMPANYALLGYGRVDRYIAQVMSKLSPDAVGSDQLATLRKVQSVSAATAFEDGKIRDVLFVAMPKLEQVPSLSRGSLALATKETFLYAASVLALSHSNQLQKLSAVAASLPPALRDFVSAFADKGVTLDEWNAAFAPEIGVLGDWPENARIPALFLSLPVQDPAKARTIAAAITTGSGESTWVTSEREGVQYFSRPPANPMVPVAATLAVGDKFLVLGLDPVSVEAAAKRGATADVAFTGTQNFQTAERLVPPPTQSFVYVDTAMLYTRLDAAVRPMLVMAAAFMPAIAETADLNKLPTADVITRHLSPLVLSQSYLENGYLTSSIGPVSVYQVVLGIAGATGVGTAFWNRQQQNATSATAPAAVPPSTLAATPEAEEEEPEPEMDETPEPTPESTPAATP